MNQGLSSPLVNYDVIGDVKPIGMCGSAYIDAVANLYKLGFLDRKGHFKKIHSERLKWNGEARFIIAWSNETATQEEIAIYAKDIEAILLAKAVIASAFQILLEKTGLKTNELERIFVAGSFGTSLNPENMIAIGLIPNAKPKQLLFVGNTAITGAKAMLKSIELKKAEKLANKINYIEISVQPNFTKFFKKNLMLPLRNQSFHKINSRI